MPGDGFTAPGQRLVGNARYPRTAPTTCAAHADRAGEKLETQLKNGR